MALFYREAKLEDLIAFSCFSGLPLGHMSSERHSQEWTQHLAGGQAPSPPSVCRMPLLPCLHPPTQAASVRQQGGPGLILFYYQATDSLWAAHKVEGPNWIFPQSLPASFMSPLPLLCLGSQEL